MVADYINYFRKLAIAHKDLQHNRDSETGDGPAGSMHFTKISAEEVLAALRTAVGWPCLTLELYETETQAEAVSDVKLLPKGAFMIVDNPESKSFQAQEKCFVTTERIIWEILRQIYQDHYGPNVDECETPFKFFECDKISVTPVSNVFGGQYGYRAVFDFELRDDLDITAPPAPGTFNFQS